MPNEKAPLPGPADAPPTADELKSLAEELAALVQDLRALLDRNGRGLPDPLCTGEEVAGHLRISARTLDGLVARKEIRPVMVGGQRRYTAATVDDYVRRAHARPSRRRN